MLRPHHSRMGQDQQTYSRIAYSNTARDCSGDPSQQVCRDGSCHHRVEIPGTGFRPSYAEAGSSAFRLRDSHGAGVSCLHHSRAVRRGVPSGRDGGRWCDRKETRFQYRAYRAGDSEYCHPYVRRNTGYRRTCKDNGKYQQRREVPGHGYRPRCRAAAHLSFSDAIRHIYPAVVSGCHTCHCRLQYERVEDFPVSAESRQG